MAKEKTIETKIKDYLKDNNIYHFKTFGSAFQKKGQPDIITIINGYYVGLELKKPKRGRPQISQILVGSDILNSGGIYAIVDDFDTFVNIITILRNENISKVFEYLGYSTPKEFKKWVYNKYLKIK